MMKKDKRELELPFENRENNVDVGFFDDITIIETPDQRVNLTIVCEDFEELRELQSLLQTKSKRVEYAKIRDIIT